jgi:protein required for attachment to host cells
MKPVRPSYVLVANRVSASLFRRQGAHVALALVSRFEHPEGRLKSGEIDTDRPGRAFDRMGGARHALSNEESSVEHEARLFALRLAEELEHARQRNEFEELAIIAPPRMLGHLRAALSTQTRALVIGELAKDLADPDGAAVREYIDQLEKPA